MTFFRRRLRLWAAIWFLFQGASLTAIVPRDCCATHGRPSSQPESARSTTSTPPCHNAAAPAVAEATPAETPCPMRAADGKACPMHRGAHATHDAHAQHAAHAEQAARVEHADHARHAHSDATSTDADSSSTDGGPCTMRALCNAPMDALVVLLVQPGVLPNRAAFAVDLPVAAAPPESPSRLIHGLFSPDLPPPRA